MRTAALSLSVFLSALAMAPGAHAEVVRCTDANGAISYTDGACPASSRQSRPVPILESPAPAPAPRSPSDEARRSDPVPQPAPHAAPSPLAQNTPSGPSIIPRNPDARPAQEPAQDPGIVILSPDPYHDGWRPARRPPPHAHDPGPPPGQRPCNLAGIKRNNC